MLMHLPRCAPMYMCKCMCAPVGSELGRHPSLLGVPFSIQLLLGICRFQVCPLGSQVLSGGQLPCSARGKRVRVGLQAIRVLQGQVRVQEQARTIIVQGHRNVCRRR